MRQDGIRGSLEHIQRDGIRCKFMSIDEPAASFVECVSGKAIVDVELAGGFYGLAKSANKSMNFFLRGLGTGDRIRASQAGKVLAEGVSGNERMKIILFVKVVAIIIPATHIGAGSRNSLTFPKRLE